MTSEARIVGAGFILDLFVIAPVCRARMAGFALIHFHGFGAVAGKDIFLVGKALIKLFEGGMASLADVFFLPLSVASDTVFYVMRRMAEKYVVGLLLVCQPRHFFFFLHEVPDVIKFRFAFSLCGRMAAFTVLSGRQTGKRTIVPESVTAAAFKALIFYVSLMGEFNRLLFLAKEEIRKKTPAKNQCNDQTDNKWRITATLFPCAAILSSTIGWWTGTFFFLHTHHPFGRLKL